MFIGITGAILSHPFDVLATRMQSNNIHNYREALNDALKNLGGYRGLFKAWWTRVILFTGFINIIPMVKSYTN